MPQLLILVSTAIRKFLEQGKTLPSLILFVVVKFVNNETALTINLARFIFHTNWTEVVLILFAIVKLLKKKPFYERFYCCSSTIQGLNCGRIDRDYQMSRCYAICEFNQVYGSFVIIIIKPYKLKILVNLAREKRI